MSSKSRKWRWAIGLIVIFILFIFALLYLIPKILPGARLGEIPRVQIRLPLHGSRLSAHEHQSVVLQAFNIDNIARYELWVDGNLVNSLVPLEGETALANTSRLSWLPGQAGIYTLVGRVYAADGNGGTSSPVVVEAIADEEPCWENLIMVQVEIKDGDTIESIAAASGGSPDCIRKANPDLTEPLEPGILIFVPVPPDQLPQEYVDWNPEEAEQTGEEASPDEPISPGDGEAQAEPGDEPGAGIFPTAPQGFEVSHERDCTVLLEWLVPAQGYPTYRIYRMSAARENFRLVGEIEDRQERAELSYVDIVPLGGQYQYYVSAVDGNRETPGPIVAVEVPRDACEMQAPMVQENIPTRLEFEATSLFTTSQFDGVHCYLSLARLEPYNRLPESDDNEFDPHNGGWNIASHASGYRRFIFMQDPMAPVPVEVECWGRRGRESMPLGTFRASHPASEWDGRSLTGDTDGFRITYHIQPFSNEQPGIYEVGVDPGIPPPEQLRIASSLPDCLWHLITPGGNTNIQGEKALALWGCQEIWDQMLVWSWSPSEVVARTDIDGFQIYVRDMTSGTEQAPIVVQGEVGSDVQVFPVPFPSCEQTYEYTVDAFISEERGGRLGPRTSPLSEPYYLPGPMCPPTTVELILEDLWIGKTDDGVNLKCEYVFGIPVFCWPVEDTVLEAYGDGYVHLVSHDGVVRDGPQVMFWSMRTGLHEGYFGPAYRSVGPHRTLNLAGEDLAICPDSCLLGANNNRMVLTVHDGDTIDFWFRLIDDDLVIPDVWCGTEEDAGIGVVMEDRWFGGLEEKRFLIGPYSTEEWSQMDETFRFVNTGEALSDQDADCALTVRVRGMGSTP